MKVPVFEGSIFRPFIPSLPVLPNPPFSLFGREASDAFRDYYC